MFKFFKHQLINWCLSYQKISIGEIYNQSSPKQVNIDGPDGNLKFTGEGISDYLVETPTGWSKISKTLKTVPYELWELKLEDGKTLIGADEHLIITPSGEKQLQNLSVGEPILTKDGQSNVSSICQFNCPPEEMYDLELDDDEHVYYTNDILSHNTITVAMYFLWLSMFRKDQFLIIASKNNSHAKEILNRVRFAYEELPFWLKAGCRYYNKHSIEFDNGSKIISEATTEKTARGLSVTKLYLDELAFIKKNIQEQLWASLAPTLSTGGGFIITSTPNGDSDLFASLWRAAVAGNNNFKPILIQSERHPEHDDKYHAEMLAKLGPLIFRQECRCVDYSTELTVMINNKIEQISIGKLYDLFYNKGEEQVCFIED